MTSRAHTKANARPKVPRLQGWQLGKKRCNLLRRELNPRHRFEGMTSILHWHCLPRRPTLLNHHLPAEVGIE